MKRDAYRQAFFAWLIVTLLLGLGGLAVCYLTPYALARVAELLPGLDLSGFSTLCILLSTWTVRCAVLLTLLGTVVWAVRHKLYRGVKYALRHAVTVARIRQKLLETEGTYFVRTGSDLVSIPCVKLTLEGDDLTRGTVTLSNHIKFDAALSKLNLSSALGPYIVTRQYQSPTANEWIFEITDAEAALTQEVFERPEEMFAFIDKSEPYHLRLDSNTTVPLTTTIISGTVGSGKSYFMFFLLFSLLRWNPKPIIFYADKKRSGLGLAGKMLCPERTAIAIDDIITLLEQFRDLMEERKLVIEEKLRGRLDGAYSDWGLPPIIFIFEEVAAFMVALDKKELERVNRVLREVVLEGRQLGVFLFLIMQKTDSTTLPTAIRDNAPLKICFGNAPDTTYVTLFEHAEVPDLDYKPGRGVYSLFESTPSVLAAPTMRFDPGKVFTEIGQQHNTATSASPPCEAKGGDAL